MIKFDVLTLFPEIIQQYSQMSILGRAQQKKVIKILAHNFRLHTTDKHNHVDDHPYGGGPGMVLQVQPIFDCLKKIKAIKVGAIHELPLRRGDIKKQKNTKIILMDPAGKKFDQRMAEKFSKLDRLVLICGRYEGFDARIHKLVDERVSVGDYVLAGGELPALTIIEAISRLIPGVLGNEESLLSETHNAKCITSSEKKTDFTLRVARSMKEYPQYTRPEDFMGWKVPKVLLSGDHKKIEEWRKSKSKN
jgi:tRNA (guanine37-N1)-methyltransferase